MTRYLFQENADLMEENKKLKEELDMVCKQYNSLLKNHNEWLAEAKKGLDAYEYCLIDLEKENAKLKQKLTDCGFWKQDGTYEEDLQIVDFEKE